MLNQLQILIMLTEIDGNFYLLLVAVVALTSVVIVLTSPEVAKLTFASTKYSYVCTQLDDSYHNFEIECFS